MTQIPREFIQQVLNRIDIIDLIDGRLTLKKKSGSNYFACCPFHHEKTPSFSVSQSKQFYHCFGCGMHGNAIDFIMQYDRLTFPEAIETLAKEAGLEVPRESRPAESQANHEIHYELLEKVSRFYQQQLRQNDHAIDYLKKRGVSGVIAKEFQLGFALPGWDHVLQTFGISASLKQQLTEIGMLIKKDDGGHYDRFRERIMFPIHDKRGRIIGFGGRILEKGEPKYLNSPETPLFQKGRELYGFFQALKANRKLERVIIVEGYMDVIALFQHGITYALATLGTATTANHLQRLGRYTSEIIFCFDGDNAGRTAAWRALEVTLPLMRDGLQVRFMFLPDGEDPDTLIRKAGKNHFEQLAESALPLSTFFFQTLANQADLNTMDGRARFVKLASDYLEELPDSIFKKMMQEELAKKARLTKEPEKRLKQAHFRPIQKVKPPSALRLALMLVIQNPALALELSEPLPILDMKGFDLLQRTLQLIQANREVNTGSLLELWRGQPDENLIAKFARMEHMVPEVGIKNEFLGAILRLKQFANEQVIDNLLAKAAAADLTLEEKKNLHHLIQLRGSSKQKQ